MKKRMIWVLLCPMMLMMPFMMQAQKTNDVQNALDFIQKKSTAWTLTDADIEGLLISDIYLTTHNGVKHIYFQQVIDGIPIYNSITGVHVAADQNVYAVGHRFISNAKSKVSNSQVKLSPAEALMSAAKNMGIEQPAIIEKEVRYESGTERMIFEASNISHYDIEIKPVYTYSQNELRLSWDLAIDDLRNADFLSIRVDAENGEILDIHNWTTYCQFDHAHKGCGSLKNDMSPKLYSQEEITESLSSGSYRVFKLPSESPSHGPHEIVNNPHIPQSSPFGWHDVNGNGQPNYTITRGNNVHAYPDLDDNDASTGGEPDGGASLNFDFPFDPNSEPLNSLDAATVNLFYMSNMMHDITYLFGFDEAAGNFQANNHGKGGIGGDYVRSEAQDGSGTNNANFSTPADGLSGRMQMFLWNSGGEVFTVLEPSIVAKGYESGTADFGPNIVFDSVDIEGEIVEAFDDDANNPSFGCGPIVNKEDLKNKIALIDRGGCFFDQKVRNCENAGAIAVIICNFDPSPVGMTGSGTVAEPSIPVIMIGSNDCQAIRVFAGRGLFGRLKASAANLVNLDGDYDNGIIAHEYGHGISNRLTGGPSQSGCLGNGEQMGEGWSDFFSLITTVEPGDKGSDARGIGVYAQRQAIDGSGIRPRQYTTDMNINELTYSWVGESGISAPHGVGSIWCTMLWDMYWALVDEYGYDEDLSNVNAGNNIAVQLVMDGMKLQTCSPGFVDGRDAILLADSINNEAANSCLIWEVFARRGLGYYANQGSSNSRFDGKENFEPAPLCQNKIRTSKSAVNIIEAGDTILYTMVIENNKTSATSNIVVTDVIPTGCNYISGSASIDPTFNGSQIIFNLGDMVSLQRETITYSVVSSNKGSATLWLDDFENGEDNWDIDLGDGFTIWHLQDEFFKSGENAFYTENEDADSDQFLFQFDPVHINLENPGIRFYHWFSTSTNENTDGGVIELSTDGIVWVYVEPEKMLRNGYTGNLPYGTFVLPNLFGFYGSSGGFIDTYIDLEDYKDQDVYIRFRMGTEEMGLEQLADPKGWVVDDVEYLDLLFYSTEMCATSDDGDNSCSSLSGKGTLVEPNTTVNTENLPDDVEQIAVYPNPTSSELRVKLDMESPSKAQFTILNLEGKWIKGIDVQLREGTQIIELPVHMLSTGTYILEMKTEKGIFSRKWMKN